MECKAQRNDDVSEGEMEKKKARFNGTGQENSCNPFGNGFRQNPMQLKAFGLEDRADAVITSGNKNWSLSNLNRWRNELSQVNTGSINSTTTNTKDFLKQRQREYRRQMMMKGGTNHTASQ